MVGIAFFTHRVIGATLGVRWRFQRLLNDIYVSAFETILFIERAFGTQLRDHAIRISKERYTLRQEIQRSSFQTADQVCPRPGKTNNTRRGPSDSDRT